MSPADIARTGQIYFLAERFGRSGQIEVTLGGYMGFLSFGKFLNDCTEKRTTTSDHQP